jgi:hypothetical protein
LHLRGKDAVEGAIESIMQLLQADAVFADGVSIFPGDDQGVETVMVSGRSFLP